MQITFHSADVDFFLEERTESVAEGWISSALQAEMRITTAEISVIFCSDEYLLGMNKEYLDHHYFTDIITFPYSEDPLTADLFISVDRVEDNAKDNGVSFEEELHRVMIHGILHLCGFEDDSEESAVGMRAAEDRYLQLWRRQISGEDNVF